MNRYLLDTNILLLYLHGSDGTIDPLFREFSEGNLELLCTVISEFELLRYPHMTPDEESAIVALLSTMRILSVDRHIATTAALLSRRFRRSAFDLLIAATALVEDIPLVTRNVRDFRGIEGLRVVAEPEAV
ncbi:type II toxin-antitoxin system VapC family toxin [Candidatus Uhrbacteria bacterium]|nr:type II toxin-antitoxin system VapC family toxin [Candidatus Uhrbacteria bacterium]